MNRPLLLGASLLVVAGAVAYVVWPRARPAPAKPPVAVVAAPLGAPAGAPVAAPTGRPRPQLSTAPLDTARQPEAGTPVIDHRTGAGVGTSPAAGSGSGSGSATPRPGPGVVVMKSMQDQLRPKVLACTHVVPADQRVIHATTTATMTASVVGGVLTVDDVDVTTLDVQEPAASALVECVRGAVAGTQVPAGADASDLALTLTFPVR